MLSATTNIAALVAKRNLDENGLQATRSIAKVSQGTRIVKPMDDASSLAIANKMRSNLAAMDQGLRNTTQGSSLLQVAAGGMERTSDILSRMKQLAVQVINDTLGPSEVSYANEEFSQLVEQIDRTAEQTRFNGNSLLTGGSGTTSARNLTKAVSDLNQTTISRNGGANNVTVFDPDTSFNEEASNGFIFHDFPQSTADIEAYAEDGMVFVKIGDELFSTDSNITDDSVVTFTSTSEPNNRLALKTSAPTPGGAITAYSLTDTESVQSIKDVFAGAKIRIGVAEELERDDNARLIPAAGSPDPGPGFDPDSPLSTTFSSGVIQGQVTDDIAIDVIGTGSDYTVRVNVGGVNDGGVLTGGEWFVASGVTVRNNEVLELVSTTNNGNRLALNFNSAAVTDITDSAEFEAALGAVFRPDDIGGGATVESTLKIGDPERATDFGSSPSFGIVIPANTPPTYLNIDNTQGFIDGVVTDVRVDNNGDAFDIYVDIGNQTFRALGYKPVDANHQLNLVSMTSTKNVISLNVNDTSDDNLTSSEATLAALENLLGLNNSENTSPVRFHSASGANHLKNGVIMGDNQTINAGIATASGRYAVSYNSENREFNLTNGVDTWVTTITEDDYFLPGQMIVEFGNGVSLSLGDGKANSFDLDRSISQMTFEISQEGLVKYEFQVSDVAGDDMGINMTAATVEALGLTGASINGKEFARDAQRRIDSAIDVLNTGLANIGALQSRFEHVRVNLTIQIENTHLARATFYDVDMGGEITEFTKSQTLVQAATSMLSQANELPQNLLRLLP